MYYLNYAQEVLYIYILQMQFLNDQFVFNNEIMIIENLLIVDYLYLNLKEKLERYFYLSNFCEI